ncbi:exonuclease SbcCD subunit D [Saccharospirillum impatiens]|uniref:exonuclease SbcCD subunit D n=1 Tax=Saccharospirillum impatiens TaxID=169438 RepID=UPI0003FDC7B5|nr:exonuclease SbcCD subunit D [Saccharospirillum impatiens]
MKLLHTSDWHLGRQFHNQSLLADQAGVLDQLIAYVESESIDVVLIAGDIYDRSVPPAEAVTLLNQTLRRLCVDLAVPVIMISGNHDSPERLGFGAGMMQGAGLHILSDLAQVDTPVVIPHADGDVAFYGIPYCQPEHVRSVFGENVRSFDEAHTFLVDRVKSAFQPGQRRVLLSHCFVSGAEESDSERPLSLGGADTVRWQPMREFDYVALGHLHAPQYRGVAHIRYCGSLMKYSFSEVTQKKGVTRVDLPASGDVDVTALPLAPSHDLRILEGEFDTLMAQGKDDPRHDDYLLVRLTDTRAILDTLNQLRQVYPNVLHLEKPGLAPDRPAQLASREQLKRTELELFADFFEQTQGEALSDAQREALTTVIQSVHQSEGQA